MSAVGLGWGDAERYGFYIPVHGYRPYGYGTLNRLWPAVITGALTIREVRTTAS